MQVAMCVCVEGGRWDVSPSAQSMDSPKFTIFQCDALETLLLSLESHQNVLKC